jgi:dTDP-4-amino-4,6-dideoxygalactose transaminase
MQGIQHAKIRKLSAPQEVAAHVYHLYVITCEQRDTLKEHLDNWGVQTHCHYPIPVHQQESGKTIRRDPAGLKNSEVHAAQCLSLPCHPQMSDDDVSTVVQAVNAFQAQ